MEVCAVDSEPHIFNSFGKPEWHREANIRYVEPGLFLGGPRTFYCNVFHLK